MRKPGDREGRPYSKPAYGDRVASVSDPFRLADACDAGCLLRRWLRKEEFCQANLGADIVLEAAYAGEVMKDIGSGAKGSPVGANLPFVAICSPPHDFSMPRATNVNVIGS